jgi:hypothetical protein
MSGAVLLSMPGMVLIVLLSVSPWDDANVLQQCLPCQRLAADPLPFPSNSLGRDYITLGSPKALDTGRRDLSLASCIGVYHLEQSIFPCMCRQCLD